MRLNRARAAVIGVVSATAIVGLPITVAAPAGAQPLGAFDNDGPDAIELPVLPHAGEDSAPPPSAEDLADPVPDVVSPAADTVTETALPGMLDVTADEAQSEPESSTPAPDAPDSPADGSEESGDSGDVGDYGDQPSDEAADQNSDADNAADEAESTTSATTDSAAVQTKATSSSSSQSATTEGSVAGASATRTQPLADTGAAAGDLLRTGLALLFGGAVLVGAGRHRRPGRARILL
jgi:hypothetical protein